MKKKTKRVVPALLSLVMAVSSVPGPAYAAPLVTLFSSAEDDTQMVSDAETVFVNFYDGSVRSQDFNSNWKFFLGNAGNAQEVNFDDSKWRAVSRITLQIWRRRAAIFREEPYVTERISQFRRKLPQSRSAWISTACT